MICRMDNSGLGSQTLATARMLKPDFIMLIDSTPFNNNKQYPERYKDFKTVTVEGIPGPAEFLRLIDSADHLLTCETPYNYTLWEMTKAKNIKTYCAPNWELFDGLVQPNMPHPDQYLIPSYWHLEDFQELYPNAIYLPPPTFDSDFKQAREQNLARRGKRRFVHVVGKPAIYDRNGWSAIMDALPQTKSDFELVVYAQQEITGLRDERVKYHIFDVKDQAELYTDFDALIMPRRYGGLALPANEALMSALPVIMTDVSPNNKVLPKSWLCDAEITARFEGRSVIDVYSPTNLAQKIDWLCGLSDEAMLNQKQQAYEIGHSNYSDTVLHSKYIDILTK